MKQLQHEITKPTPVLDEKGHVFEPGYCKDMLYQYDHDKISANKFRSKEWDFYQISDGRYLIQLTIANISMGDGAVLNVLDMSKGQYGAPGCQLAWSIIPHLLTTNRYRMPTSAREPSVVERKFGPGSMKFEFDGKTRHLTAKGISMNPAGVKYDIDLKLEVMDGLEGLVTLLPYDNMKDHFFMTDKIDSMPVSGTMKIGNQTITFDPKKAIGVLDWGRVVAPYRTTWYWANGGGYLKDGKLFGMEITYGIGNDINATETAVFYDGKCHKVGPVAVTFDPIKPGENPWYFKEETGRIDLRMDPYFDNSSVLDLGVMGMNTVQIHGKLNGTVTLDDGTKVEVSDVDGFCEYCRNKW